MDLVKQVEKLINTFIGENTDVTNDDFEIMINELISLRADIQEAYIVIKKQDKIIEAQQQEIEQLKLSGCRKEVIKFARAMEQELKNNDHKSGWKDCSMVFFSWKTE